MLNTSIVSINLKNNYFKEMSGILFKDVAMKFTRVHKLALDGNLCKLADVEFINRQCLLNRDVLPDNHVPKLRRELKDLKNR